MRADSDLAAPPSTFTLWIEEEGRAFVLAHYPEASDNEVKRRCKQVWEGLEADTKLKYMKKHRTAMTKWSDLQHGLATSWPQHCQLRREAEFSQEFSGGGSRLTSITSSAGSAGPSRWQGHVADLSSLYRKGPCAWCSILHQPQLRPET